MQDVRYRYTLIFLLLLAVVAVLACSGPQLEADPSWTPATVLATPTGADAVAEGEPTPLNIPTTQYRIKAGETLTDIATRYGLTVDELAALNDIDNPNRVEVGQEIKVPRTPLRR